MKLLARAQTGEDYLTAIGVRAGQPKQIAGKVYDPHGVAHLQHRLAQLPRENGAVPARFKIASLPGTRTYFSPEKKQFVPTSSSDARVVNLTVVDSRAPGWLQVGRCTDVGPEGKFSNLNVGDAGARANMALVPAGDSGTCALGMSQAHHQPGFHRPGRFESADGAGRPGLAFESANQQHCQDGGRHSRPVGVLDV